MEKYDIDPENLSTLNFEELYTAAVKKARRTEFENSLMKAMGESALKGLNCWKESPMKSDAVIVHTDGTFPSAAKPVKSMPVEEEVILNTVIWSQLDDLNLKAENLQLILSSFSERL